MILVLILISVILPSFKSNFLRKVNFNETEAYQDMMQYLRAQNSTWIEQEFQEEKSEPQEGIEHFTPVIGIFAQPSEDYATSFPPEEGYSYISESYVNWVESAGARVVPIPYNYNDEELDFILKRVNGVVIPGGDASLWINESEAYGFANQTVTGYKILERAQRYNNAKNPFPIWATCMGYEMVVMIVANDTKVLDHFDSKNHSLDTQIIRGSDFSENRIYSGMPEDLFQTIETKKAFYYNHRYGLDVGHFYNTYSLSDNFKLTSQASYKDQTFVATLEGEGSYNNVFLSQYHPEKNAYEWMPDRNVNHAPKAIEASQYEIYMTANVARESKNRFDSFDQFQEYSIKKYTLTNSLDIGDDHHVATYFFQAHDNTYVNRNIQEWDNMP